MKWLAGIWQIAADLSTRCKTILVFSVVILVAGYFFLDRVLTYQRNMAQIQRTQPSSIENVSPEKYANRELSLESSRVVKVSPSP